MQLNHTLVLVSLMSLPQHALACSETTPCDVEGGSYYVALPDNASGPIPAVIWIHGFGSSGAAIFRQGSVPDAVLSQGYALIAPDGLKRENGQGGSWSFHPNHPRMTPRRDEIEFLLNVRDAAIAKHNLDPDKLLLSGFSIGGSMTSYFACADPDGFTAYAPLAGSFWRPHPQQCEGPVKVLHTHGWDDGTVPLEGRVLRGENSEDPDMLAQGDVFHSMDIWRQTNDCLQLKADTMDTNSAFWHRAWTRCAEGSALEFVLYPGGHVIPDGWAEIALDWFEDVAGN